MKDVNGRPYMEYVGSVQNVPITTYVVLVTMETDIIYDIDSTGYTCPTLRGSSTLLLRTEF